MIKELTKEFFRPIIMVFWLGVLLAVAGGIAWHYIDKKVQAVTESISAVTAPLQSIGQPIRKVADDVQWFAEGCDSLAEGYERDKEQIHSDFADAITETFYNFFPKE